jgi:hypothetical protein
VKVRQARTRQGKASRLPDSARLDLFVQSQLRMRVEAAKEVSRRQRRARTSAKRPVNRVPFPTPSVAGVTGFNTGDENAFLVGQREDHGDGAELLPKRPVEERAKRKGNGSSSRVNVLRRVVLTDAVQRVAHDSSRSAYSIA